jgi:hypothetical protein
MRSLAIALLLGAAGLAHSQATSKPPAAPGGQDHLFPAPPSQAPGKPQFKWQYPDPSHRFFILPPEVQTPVKPTIHSDVDPGISRKPKGFAQQPSRPAPHSDIYPGLKIQPTEIAKLEAFSAYPDLKAEPIPTVFPKAKFEPIPITWDEFRVIPVGAAASSTP